MAFAIEEDEAAGAVSALAEQMNCFARRQHRSVFGTRYRRVVGMLTRRIGHTESPVAAAKQVDGSLRHDDFHDGFAVAGAGYTPGGGIGIAAAADERRIADATGEFAAGASRGCGGKELAVRIERDGAYSALLVPAMMSCGVLVLATLAPGLALCVADEFLGIAKSNAAFFGEALSAFADQHHVGTVFEHGACKPDGIADALQSGDRAGTKRLAIHHDGIAFDAAIQIEMRAKAGVENGLVFKNEYGGFDGVQRGTAARKNGPSCLERAAAARFARFNRFIGNIPSASMDNQSGFHREENGKARRDCPAYGKAAVFIG